MNNPFEYSNDNKRYHTWNYHLRQRFHGKVFKVSLNAGFTCPNIDGTKGYGGCTFCSIKGSGDFAGNPTDDLKKQFDEIRDRMKQKWESNQYIAYFQAFSNTYAPLPVLKEKFEAVLGFEGVIGISIGTRPDCLADDVIDYLGELATRTNLFVELGLQTIHEETADYINRGHDLETFRTAVKKLKAKGIDVVVHIINGLPHETDEMMLETAKEVARLGVSGIKIHLLHVLKKTVMAHQLEKKEFELMTMEHYVKIVCDQLEVLPKELVVHRVTGDGAPDELIGPLWSKKKFVVMNEIDKELVRRDSYQGKYYET